MISIGMVRKTQVWRENAGEWNQQGNYLDVTYK